MIKNKTVCLIGAGNIGSRHLQGLKLLKTPLDVFVIEPSKQASKIAQERYESVKGNNKHSLLFQQSLNDLPQDVDVAIVATNSEARAKVTTELLKKSKVNYIIFEKLLFNKKVDYKQIGKLLSKSGSKAFVNCSMRTQPFYWDLKAALSDKRIDYFVTGSNYGLVSNAIHFLDHVAYLTNSVKFSVETNFLNNKAIKSKREGYLELTGQLIAKFQNGSLMTLSCSPSGNSPIVIEVHSNDMHCISIDSQTKAYIATQKSNWGWSSIQTQVPYQSQLTNGVVNDLLKTGTCKLTPFSESAKIHILLLEPLLKFLNKISRKKYNYYPFT